ncbi:MAG: right-handed parallel beta-helix repeat-containing protein, partial [FCB group bacterium]|nr:right-handed parallel beta-helix repeat-containing protein [FCB group bacterium]
EGHDNFQYAIWAENNKTVRHNIISCDNLQRAIYVQNNCIIDSNTITGNFDQEGLIHIAGDTVSIHDNTINQTGSGTVIYSQGNNAVSIYDNEFQQSGSARWISFDNTEADVHHNTVSMNTGRGVEFFNQSGGSIYNNTLISSGTGDYGIFLTNQTAIPIYNNIVQGFMNGIYAENTIQNYNLDHNNLYAIEGSLFSGSAIPPLAGQMIDQNANGDASDIYANISFDPQFVDPSNDDYDLVITSPCINAGTDNLSDPDGTVSDIGANYHFIYIVIDHTPLQSTIDTNGPYTVEAQVVSTISAALDVSLFYSTDGGTNFSEVVMTPGANDSWSSSIPGQALNTTIHYYLEANDGSHHVNSPFNIENEVYSFYVTLFSQFANLGGSSDTFGDIDVSWSTPVPMVGTLEGLKLYRSMASNVSLTPGNLYQEFATDVTSFTDTNVEEGDTYYYRMTGLVAQGNDTTESVVSSEIGVLSDDATVVRVRGMAYLENQSDHSGTKVYFEKTSPSAVTDSVYTDTDGYYDVVLVTGIYNAHFTQDGYQPQLLGHQFFSGNAYLDTLTLVPGGVVSLSGNVSGIFTSNNLYFVDGNITIPDGDTLIIEAGTQILFRGNYSLTANGPLFVNGNANNKVTFSSRLPVPAVGDWNSITLNSGATGSTIKYATYKYATDGFICNNLNNLTIWGCVVNTLAINARAITLNNCENVDIRYNTLSTPGDWVIYKPQDEWDNSGIFIANTINAANSGMYIRYFNNLQVDSNQVQVTNIGIRTDYSQNLLCRYNSISGQDHNYGFHTQNCPNSLFTYNSVIGSREFSYYLAESDNIYFAENQMFYVGSASGTKGIYTGGCDGSTFQNNQITYSDSLGQYHYYHGFYGGNNSTYKNNRIFIWKSGNSENGAFRDINNSIFEGNYVELQSYGGGSRFAFSGTGNTSINDTLILGYETQGFYGNNWTIQGATIQSITNNNNYPAIECRGGVLNVDDVTISGMREGIYGTGVGGHINNTLIDVYGSYYGVKIENNSTMFLYKNTIIGNSIGTGIWSTTNATVTTNSNIVKGFATGLLAESQNTIQTSLFYGNAINFTGSELPPQVGDVVTVNSNADPSDIYGNIFLNPQFVDPGSGNYQLQSGSPAINAGDIESLDLDGTVADIGAYFYNFGYVPMDLVADSTGNGYVALSWDIIASDSIQNYIPYYKLASSGTWLSSSNTSNSHTIITGLNNNVDYHFAVAVQYPAHESDRSATITVKPGLSQLVLSTDYIVSHRDVGETVVESFDMSNPGNRDLVWSLAGLGAFDAYSGIVSPAGSVTVHDTLVSYSNQVNVGAVLINTNDPEHFLDAVGILNIVGNYAAVPVDHFSPLTSGDDSYWVAFTSAQLDGSSLQSGDE